MSMDGNFLTIHAFDGDLGKYPTGALVQGKDGDFYGTTVNGGPLNGGVVFKVSPAGVVTRLAFFTGYNGAYPLGGLTMGADGNLYGTTEEGGVDYVDSERRGNGTVFRITPSVVSYKFLNVVIWFGFEPNFSNLSVSTTNQTDGQSICHTPMRCPSDAQQVGP
jgi:uncharacterized repeat protein (TIGR03803 family)